MLSTLIKNMGKRINVICICSICLLSMLVSMVAAASSPFVWSGGDGTTLPVWRVHVQSITLPVGVVEVSDELAIIDRGNAGRIVGVISITNPAIVPVTAAGGIVLGSNRGFSNLVLGPGFTPGNDYSFQFWDSSADVVYTDCSSTLITTGGWDSTVFPTLDAQQTAVELTFHANAQTYTVSYHGNGHDTGTVPIDSNVYTSGETVTVLGNMNSLARSGYDFVEWNTAADGSGTSYAGSTSFVVGSDDVVLYASWMQQADYDHTVSTLTDVIDDNYEVGHYSLREAITQAVAGDTIGFSVSGTITLAGTSMLIDKSISIDGDSHIVIDAQNLSRIFNIDHAGSSTLISVTLKNMTLTAGHYQVVDSHAYGGAIYNEENLTLEGVSITNSTVIGDASASSHKQGYGGGLYHTYGTLAIRNCTFSGNRASGIFDGIKDGYGNGGAVALGSVNNTGSAGVVVSIENSTFMNNSATTESASDSSNLADGGALYCRVDANPRVSVEIINSTISNNVAEDSAGGLYCDNGIFSIYNSTITQNTCSTTDGIVQISNDAEVSLFSTIITGNNSAVDIETDHETVLVQLDHCCWDSSGVNETTTAFATGPAAYSVTQCVDTIDPLLADLADNGGVTYTHALQPGSLALNSGANLLNLTTDQRGDTYERVFDGMADIGAYENQEVVLAAEIMISGQGIEIPDETTTVSLTQGTDFAEANISGIFIDRIFTIANTGGQPLTLTDVSISGSSAFSILVQPASNIAPTESTTMTVRFDPLEVGTASAQISVTSNDFDEDVYTFALAGAGTQSGFTVYAWNAYKLLDQQQTRDFIVGMNADVLVLTEVDSEAWVETLQTEMATASGYSYALYYPTPQESTYQLAVLSRFPFISTVDGSDLAHDPSDKITKSMPIVRITVDGEIFTLAGIHANTAKQKATHENEANELLSVIDAESSNVRTLVLGDFNSRAQSDGAVTDLTHPNYTVDGFSYPNTVSTDAFIAAGYVDAWRFVHPHRAAPATKSIKNGEDPGSNMGERIDHIFVSSDIVIADAGVLYDASNDLSDHKPVWARIQTTGSCQTRGGAMIDAGPRIYSSSLAADNSSMSIVFDRPVYAHNNQSGALDAAHFEISFEAGSAGTATNCAIASVSHVAGSDTVVFSLVVSGVVAGTERIRVHLAGDNNYSAQGKTPVHVYDVNGVADVWTRMLNGQPYASDQRTQRHVLFVPVVNTPPVAQISTPIDASSVMEGTQVAFAGTATDAEDGSLSGVNLVWSSSLDGQIATGASFSTSSLTVGIHLISLTATDSLGATDTEQVTLTVNDAGGPSYDIVVTSEADSGAGTLRQAVSDALAGNTIGFGSSVNIINLSDFILIDKALTIDGGRTVTVDGGNITRLFRIDYLGTTAFVDVTLKGLTLQNAYAQTADMHAYGGALYNEEHLTIDNCVLKNNTVVGDGKDNGNGTSTTRNGYGGALYHNYGTLTIGNSVFSDNRATGIDDTIQANKGYGVGYGGAVYVSTKGKLVTISNSTFSDNRAIAETAAWSDAGALYLRGLEGAVISNSTISGNSCVDAGGGVYVDNSLMTVYNSTITGNSAHALDAGGIQTTVDGSVALYSTIIAGQQQGYDIETDHETSPVIIDHCLWNSTNVNEITSSYIGLAAFAISDSQDVTDPLLHVLADNGGQTLTHVPMAMSLAIDKGSNELSLLTDQRGQARTAGEQTDIGAVELQSSNTAPIADIIAPSDESVFDEGVDIVFVGTGTDSEDGVLSGASIVWSSDRDGILGTGASLTVSTLSLGSHIIRLTVTDSGGADHVDAIVITITGDEPIYDIVVLNGNDSGVGSLRQAVSDAAEGDIIGFDGAVTTISLHSEILINKDLSIDGAGHITLSGSNQTRLFYLYKNGLELQVNLSGLTMDAAYNTANVYGGALYNKGEVLALSNCTFSNNTVETLISGSVYGGACYLNGPTTISHCLFIGNEAIGRGDDILNKAKTAFGGALYVKNVDVIITDSRFTANNARGAGDTTAYDYGYGGAVYVNSSVSEMLLTITNTTIDANIAQGVSLAYGGAIYSYAGADDGLTLRILNSTLSGNQAICTGTSNARGGMLYMNRSTGGSGLSSVTVELDNTTVANNSVSSGIASRADGGAVYGYRGDIQIRSCIIADNVAEDAGQDLYINASTIDSVHVTYSLIESLDGNHGQSDGVDGNRVGVDPILEPLSNQGGLGPVQTIDAASPCVDTGGNPNGLINDQTGGVRTQGAGTDMGAYEVPAGMG